MLMEKDQFKKVMRSTLDKHLTLANPLFKHLLNKESPNTDLLQFTALQGYQLTKYFLTYIEHIFFYCPLPRHKTILLHNLYEEETGALSRTKNHVVLMQDFIRAIGISDEQRDAVAALPATQELIDYRLQAVKDRQRYHIGAAAVLVASEGQT